MMPHTIIEGTRVHAEQRRERSLALHAQLKHLPSQPSLLARIWNALRPATTQPAASRKTSPAVNNVETSRPAALSR